MHPHQKSEEYGSLLFHRITEYQKKFRSEEEKYSNVPKLFRDVFFVSEGQKINNIVFFDNGRTEEFRPLEVQVNQPVGIFDTTISDPQNDKVLAEFLDEMKKKYKVIIPSDYPNRHELDEQIKKLAISLCKEVKIFYDGNGQNIDQRCEAKIRELKRTRKNSLIYLGELKGCGVCRHRSILFKLFCDIFGIQCRVLRGWFMYLDRSEPHMWNEIIISKQRSLVVDSSNFVEFRSPREEVHGILVTYKNLGHPQRSAKILRMNADRLQKLFTENDGQKVKEHLGKILGKPGAFGTVRELQNVVVIDDESEDLKWAKRVLAVKEVNISDLTRYDSNEEAKDRIERIIKKEVDRMTLLQHKNIAQIYCYFFTETNDEKIVNIVMEKYDMNGDEFLKVLNRLGKSNLIKAEKREAEVSIFLLEILKGLKYIHSFGIIHFDIKPQNILLNWDEKEMTISDVVISDFGSSKNEKMNFNLTSTPFITRQFAAPEILEMMKNQDENSDFVFSTSSDIYSFGVLMGAFLQCFDESNEKEKLMKIQSFCVKKNVKERPQIDEILNCVGEVLKIIMEKLTRREVYTWGISPYGVLGHGEKENKLWSPKLIEKLSISSSDIENLFCGNISICVLMKNGSVLSWGSNKFRKIGSDKLMRSFSTPSVVLSLPERNIVQVFYNELCTLYLDSKGSVWVCGWYNSGCVNGKNSYGIEVTKPPVEIISEKMGYSKMVKICCSSSGVVSFYFYGCIDIEGRLFTWGSGNEDSSALKGHGEDGKNIQYQPTLVYYFKDIPVSDCKMGVYGTLVLSRNGKVYSFGDKDYLGRELKYESSSDWISTPGIIDELEDKKITKISSGYFHRGVLDSIGNCYLWGQYYKKLPTPIRKFKNVSGDLISLEIPSKHRFVQVDCGLRRTIFLLQEKTENSRIVHHVLTSKYGSIPSVVEEFENIIVQKVCTKWKYFSVLVEKMT